MVLLWGVCISGCESGNKPHFFARQAGPEYTGADFHLTDHRGQKRRLADFKGKVVVLFFGYTHCPDVCPTRLADLSHVLDEMGKSANRVQVLFVTLDPARDKQELLAKFVPAFNSSFLGLYGTPQETVEAVKSFKVQYQKVPAKNGYFLDHSTVTYIIDQQGVVRLLAGDRESDDQLSRDIGLLLLDSQKTEST